MEDEDVDMCAVRQDYEDQQRTKALKSLSLELDNIYSRSKSSYISSNNNNGLAACNENQSQSRASSVTRSDTSSMSREKVPRLNLQKSSCCTSVSDCIETPISPSQAGVFNSNDKSTLLPVRTFSTPKKKIISDHKLCFDLETSMDERQTKLVWETTTTSADQRIRRHESAGSFTRDNMEDSSGVSSDATDSMQPTHRATHRFIPRHDDEVLLEVGDPIYVDREMKDDWCYGTNLRTGQRGIFPLAHAFEIDFEEECGSIHSLMLKAEDKATFYLTLLGTIEVAYHKGNDVLVQAINRILDFYQNKSEILAPNSVLLDISFRGIHVIDKSRKNFFRCPNFDYFYSLQNISFCGAHPKQLRYFAFITKHPLLPRFACHVFLSNGSTQPVVDAIGRAFRRSYDEYMAYAHPTEDIYLD